MKTQYLQSDGKVLSVEFANELELDPWQSQVHVYSPTDGRQPDARRRRTFHVAHRGNYDWMIGTRFSEREPYSLTMGDGQLMIYSSTDPRATQGLMLWRGPYHEVQTYLPNDVALDGGRAVDYMADLTFEDSPTGLVIHPHPDSGQVVQVFESFTYVPGISGLTFHSAAVGLGFVPTWKGASAPAGELWKSDDGLGMNFIVLAADSAVCVLTPAAGKASLMSSCLDLASSIRGLNLAGGAR